MAPVDSLSRRLDEPAPAHSGRTNTDDTFEVTCPYCGEELEIFVEADVSGSFVQDCEVCCRPWLVRVSGEEEEREVTLQRDDGED